MKQRFLIYLTLCALGAALLVLWFRPAQHQSKSAESKEGAEHFARVAPEGISAAQATSASNQTPSSPLAPTAASTNSGNPQNRVNELRQTLSEKNSPIDFYGRVIDQASNSLAGVKFKIYIRHWELLANAMSNPIRVEKETDADGRFEVHGETGDVLNVESIQKAGYELEPTQRSFGPSGGTAESPIVFKMWSTNIHEQLVTGQKSFQITPDGRTYAIDLTRGTLAESGDGDLKVWVKRPAQVAPGDKYDWSCEIAAVNGGVLQESNLNSSMYSAPIDGYKPMFRFEQKVGSGWGDTTGTMRFYIELSHGQTFGRMSIELFAYYNENVPGLVRIQYAVNPSGSRLLR
jgi:hypothetical protein